ncbi:primosomal I domain protein, partial [Escherichia coli 09BKT078844]
MTFRDALTRRWIYTAITVAIGCPETLAMVRHLGSFGMSCHNLSQALAILTSSDTEL